MPDNDIRAKALDRLCQVKRALENAKAPFTAVTWELLAEERREPYRAAMEPYVDAIADLLAAPARVIETADLDALPIMSVVLAYGVAHQAIPGLGSVRLAWLKPTGQSAQSSAELLAATRGKGVTVLYEPEEDR